MKLLFIGDIVGKPGRRAVAQYLPNLRREHVPDLVVANAENAAGGLGATAEVLNDLKNLGIQAFTLGNHTWRKKSLLDTIDTMPEVLRPANFPSEVPGRGSAVFDSPSGKVGVINLIGRVFMEPFGCPFAQSNTETSWLRQETNLIFVDMHAEATSEKIALSWHLDGRVTAVLGTHTHVQTADDWIMPKGTAYISDVGMCGPYHSVIGTKRDRVIDKFRTGIPRSFEVASGPAQFCAVLVTADPETGHATQIQRFLFREGA